MASNSCSKEVITLQFGHYANFVGTHWWNFLFEELQAKQRNKSSDAENCETEPEIFFHNAHLQSGDALPRLVSLDVKECLGALSESGHFASADIAKKGDSTSPLWQGETQVANRAPQKRGEIGGGEKSVKVWSDFLATRLHPKTMVLMPTSSSQDETDLRQDTESWTVAAKQVCEEIEDRIRFFSEACDSLEGFHVLTTVHDGCSALCVDMLNYLTDDFNRKCIFLAPLAPPHLAMNSNNGSAPVQRLINWAKFLPAAWAESSLIVPLTLSADSLWQGPTGDEKYPTVKIPNVHYNADFHYHTSALLATALDTSTLPYRLSATGSLANSPRCGMGEFFSSASKYLKINQMEIVVPYPVRQPPPAGPNPVKPAVVKWTSLTAPSHINKSRRLLSRCATLRGVEVLANNSDKANNQHLSAELKRHLFTEAGRDFEATLDATLPVVDSFVKTSSNVTARQLSTGASFPKGIFPGLSNSPANSKSAISIASALVSSGSGTGTFLDKIQSQCDRLSRAKYGTLLPEITEWGEHLEWLIEKAQYAHGLK